MLLQQQQQQQQLISHHDALSRFDAAVADFDIVYSPTTPISLTDDGFQFQFRICPQFLHKPQLPAVNAPADPTKSDIGQPLALHITTVPPAHNLIFNAFPIWRPSYLLITTCPLHRQSSPLSLADMTAARSVLAGLCHDPSGKRSEGESKETGDYMVIYNSGRASGCSRSHKHMQLFPRPPRTSFPLFPDHPPDGFVNVPYVYDLIRHPPLPSSSPSDDSSTLTYIITSYNSSLHRFRALLGIHSDDQPVPHNVVMTREWTVVIPRRAARVGGVSANAAGMMGLVCVGTEGEVEEWKKRGPWSVLEALGVKARGEGHGDKEKGIDL